MALRTFFRYASAIAVVVAVVALKRVIPGLGTPAPFLLVSLTIALAAWTCGRWPGIVAAVVGAVAVNVFIVERPADDTATIILAVGSLADFVFMAVAASALRDALRGEADARQAAERAVRARDAFISTIAHELRNPLTTVLAASEMLERGLGQDPANVARAKMIAHQARVANALIGDLLDATRPDVSRVAITAAPVDLAAIARTAASAFTPRLDARHQLTVDVPDDAPVVGDAMRLEQVLTNLLQNAQKYSPDGCVIELSVRREGASVLTRVSDRGVGVGRDDVGKLFEPFYRGRPDAFEGLGLGLYISRIIVRRHGGDLSYSARPGGGSTFVVRLPAAAIGVERQPSAQDAALAAAEPSTTSSPQ